MKGGLKEIDIPFEIKEENKENHMGFCHCVHKDWVQLNEHLKFSEVEEVEYIGMRLIGEETNKLLDTQALIATFLHELSHCKLIFLIFSQKLIFW